MDLTQYGYDATVARFNNYLSGADLWSSIYLSAPAQAFVRMYAWVMEALTHIDEENIKDLKFGTSVSLQAMLEHIKLVGYKARRNVSSEMTVQFSVVESYVEDIIIPKYTTIQVLNNYYVTKTQVQLLAGNTTVNVDVIQGFRETFNFIGIGIKDQQYDIVSANAENDNVIVYVDGVLWTEVDSFYGHEGTDEIFVQRTIYSGVRIEFGDGVFGKMPLLGSTVQVIVLNSVGELGNINLVGVEGNVVDIIYGPGGVQVDLSVNTVTVATGGQEPETVIDIKRNVPVFNTSGGVYKRKSEVKVVFENFTEISQVHVVTEADKSEIERDMKLANIINIYAVPAVGYSLTYAVKESIINYLISEEKILLNTTYNIQEAEYVKMRINIVANVPDTVSYSNKSNELESRLNDYFEGFTFGNDFLHHLLRRALIESIEDGLVYVRDDEISNIRIDTSVVQNQSDFEEWWALDGFEADLNYNDLTEDGIFTENIDEIVGSGPQWGALWVKHTAVGTLKKYPIVSFKAEVSGVVVVTLITTGSFSSSGVQGYVDFTTGVYEMTVADNVTGSVIIVYEYYDEDIPLKPEEYPSLYDLNISIVGEVNL